jgi:hypothetical protein
MKRIKTLKKLSLDALTIRVLSSEDARLVVGGAPTDTNEPGGGGNRTPLCQKPITFVC